MSRYDPGRIKWFRCCPQLTVKAPNKGPAGALDVHAGKILLDRFEAGTLPAIDLDQFKEDGFRARPDGTVGGTVDHHLRQVRFEGGHADQFVQPALVVPEQLRRL